MRIVAPATALILAASTCLFTPAANASEAAVVAGLVTGTTMGVVAAAGAPQPLIVMPQAPVVVPPGAYPVPPAAVYQLPPTVIYPQPPTVIYQVAPPVIVPAPAYYQPYSAPYYGSYHHH